MCKSNVLMLAIMEGRWIVVLVDVFCVFMTAVIVNGNVVVVLVILLVVCDLRMVL